MKSRGDHLKKNLMFRTIFETLKLYGQNWHDAAYCYKIAFVIFHSTVL